jgi:hypothetical protein
MGAIVNAVTIVICGIIGIIFKAGISERFNERIMHGIGLCVLVLGIVGVITVENTMVMIVSVLLGAITGEALKLEERLVNGVKRIEDKVKHLNYVNNLGEGFIAATMIFCVGSMAIVGALESGLLNNHSTLYAKSILDGIVSILLASSLGAGVILSSLPVLLYEGAITLLAGSMAPYLSDIVINEVVVVGSLLLIGLGLNLLEITELKIMNYVPAMLFPVIIMQFL